MSDQPSELELLSQAPVRGNGGLLLKLLLVVLLLLGMGALYLFSDGYREQMHSRLNQQVEGQLAERLPGVKVDPALLAAIAKVPREQLVPLQIRPVAYYDIPLPAGEAMRSPQPTLIALLIQLAKLRPEERVLLVGGDCAYPASLLSELGLKLKIRCLLATPEQVTLAGKRIKSLGHTALFEVGVLRDGWSKLGPYDLIIALRPFAHTPADLIAQIAPQGRLLLPLQLEEVGDQQLMLLERQADGSISREKLMPVNFGS